MSEEHTPTSGELVPTEEETLSAEGLSPEELAGQDGQALPEREAMSSLNLNISGVENFAMPINEASALNYNSPYSVAAADADQTVILGQAAETGGEHPDEEGLAAQGQPTSSGEEGPAAETQPTIAAGEPAQNTGEGDAEQTTDAGDGATSSGDASGEGS